VGEDDGLFGEEVFVCVCDVSVVFVVVEDPGYVGVFVAGSIGCRWEREEAKVSWVAGGVSPLSCVQGFDAFRCDCCV